MACKARPRRRGSDGRWTKLTGSCCARKQTNSCRTRGLALQWARDILSLAKGVAKPVVLLQNRLVCRDLNCCDRRVELPRIRCFAREKADRAAALSACLAQPQQRLVRPADWTLQVRRRSRRGLCVRVGGVKLLRPVLVARELSEALLPPLRRRGCGHTARVVPDFEFKVEGPWGNLPFRTPTALRYYLSGVCGTEQAPLPPQEPGSQTPAKVGCQCSESHRPVLAG